MIVALLAADPALGSAGTVRSHADSLGGDPCVVVAGSDPVRVDLGALLAIHTDRRAQLTIAVRRRAPGEEGTDVLIADEDGRVIGVQPAPHPDEALSELVDAGVYVVAPEALHHVGPGRSELGADLLPALLSWDATVHVHEEPTQADGQAA